jgi:hypothetical protein
MGYKRFKQKIPAHLQALCRPLNLVEVLRPMHLLKFSASRNAKISQSR